MKNLAKERKSHRCDTAKLLLTILKKLNQVHLFLQNQNGKILSDCYYSMTFFINRTLTDRPILSDVMKP